MITEFQMQKIQDRVNTIKSRMSVGLFLDLDSVLADLDEYVDEEVFANLRDKDVADVVHNLALGVGRPSTLNVYYSADLEREDGIEHGVWRARSIQENRTYKESITHDGVNLQLLFDAYDAAVRQRMNIAILVVGQTNYTALARKLIDCGVTVMMVGNYQKENRTLPRDSCLYVPMRSIMVDESSVTANVDLDNFDFCQFIRLLSASESMMSFVGVRFFIHKVMWRLGSQFKNPYVCQQLFQLAKDRNLVEVYKQENLEHEGKPVSACRLNRETSEVQSVLTNMEEATTPKNGALLFEPGELEIKSETMEHPGTQLYDDSF
jgi:hypothetical protein